MHHQRLSARRLHSGRLQIGIGGRDRLEQVADFKSESAADFISESVADLRRNQQKRQRNCPLPGIRSAV
jgi:hypothetical protein